MIDAGRKAGCETERSDPNGRQDVKPGALTLICATSLMNRTILIAIFWATQGCSEKEHVRNRESGVLPKNAAVQTGNDPQQESLLQAAKLKFPELSFNNAETFKACCASIGDYADRVADSENLTRGQALNELFLALINHENELEKTRIKAVFGQVFLEDSRGLSVTMSELPAGDLRRNCVAYIRGKGLGSETLSEIYSAMPQSADRSAISKMFVSKSYYEGGVETALISIQSLKTDDERKKALYLLTDRMSGSNANGRRKITVLEIAKVREYAKRSGYEDQLEALAGINTEGR